MLFDTSEGSEEIVDAPSGDQKGHSEARRVDRKQAYSFKDRVTSPSQREDGSQNGSDAGGPSEAEASPHRERAEESWGTHIEFESRVPEQPGQS